MSFTYDPDQLKTSLLFQVRLKTGQTNPNSLLVLSDEEINYYLDESGNSVQQTSVDVLNSLISRSHELVDKTTGQVSESQSQIMDNLIRLRDDILNSLSRATPSLMQFTGVFIEDMDTISEDAELFHDGVRRKDKGPREA